MEWLWVVLSTTLLVFCLRITYIRGYRAGARRVLAEWKKTLNELEDIK